MRRLRSDQRGMSLPELMVTMSIGMIILLAAFTLLDRSNTLRREITDRTDSSQRGRMLMDELVTQLRSQVCMDPVTVPIVSATGTSVSFYADFGEGDGFPERRTLTYDPTTATISEQRYVRGATGYPTSPTQTRQLATDVALIGTTPLFRYYGYQGAPATPTQLLTTPLSATDRAKASKIDISFKMRPTGAAAASKQGTTLNDQVIARVIDPNSAVPAPACS
jgi:prepilin-type N-terminal cleavage/methylation domain-containing protein